MMLHFHFTNYIYEYLLPSINDRRIKINLDRALDVDLYPLSLEIWDHVWYILADEDIHLTVNGTRAKNHVLKIGDVINGVNVHSGIAFAIRVSSVDEYHTFYDKFSLASVSIVNIGGSDDSDIVVKDEYVSRQHASLNWENERMVLTDLSKNGTYVQGQRVHGRRLLEIMDDIYIAGIKLIYMGDFLAINHGDKRLVKLPAYMPPQNMSEIPLASDMLIRSPRITQPLYTEAVDLESPPAPQQLQQRPVIFTIGPALTMPLPIIAAMMFNFSQGTNMIVGMVMSVVLSSLVAASWAIANVVYERKNSKKQEKHRQEAYKNYIAENEMFLIEKQRENTAILHGQYLGLDEISSVLFHNKAVLWNRNANQPDFLTIRLGKGYTKTQFEIIVPKRKFSLVADELQAAPHDIKQKYDLVPDSISLVDFRNIKVLGVIGSSMSVQKIAGNIALQLASLHCYTDVKLAFIIKPEEMRAYSWASALPHVRWQENKLRLMCATDNQRQNVLYYLNGVLRSREEASDSTDAPAPVPHIVIFCTDPSLLQRENISRYISNEFDCGVTFVLLYEHSDRLPNECSHIIQWDDFYSGYFMLNESREKINEVRFDEISGELQENLARRIGGYQVAELSTGEIPSSISFLEMYGITNLDEWELNKRWRENRAFESLKALIGIGAGGKPLYLDIHEKQHGPHGLIAGTTGSGKSETIQTYILSLVMNFHPNEIALILIDYKGGGMANTFLGIPHLAGTITNLDGNQTNRALRSIKAEIKRRQTLFNEFNVNHIDSYSRFFREGTATEPMPHLIIISDEFAELKKEQPEFIKELVSTARVGRSLGVHLILATQKPSGVVDDEIWSNSRFKICLRVQDKQDSNEMLHRPEAAYLTNIGRAYMQIGNDEIFELFQSGYSGAHYLPGDAAAAGGTVTMVALDGSQMMVSRKKSSSLSEDGKEPPTHLSASVQFIQDTAKTLAVNPVRPLWLPDLQEGITLEEIYASYPVEKENGIAALIGVIDDPSRQLQYGAVVNFSTVNNLLIAGIPGSGKSTMIQSMLYNLVMNYTPEDVNFYVIDCSGSLTRVFADLPHCGAVIGPDDEERTMRLFGLIQEMINQRSQLFEKAQVGSYDEYCLASDGIMPTVLLVIDNLFAFNDRYPDLVEDVMLPISHSCAKYGIHLVVSANHLSDVKFKLRQNFTSVLPLQLAERGDYHDAFGVMPEFVPPAKKGRGLWGKDTLEYQAALPVAGDNEQLRAENMRANFAKAGYMDYSGFRAVSLRSIPKDQLYTDFMAENPVATAIGIGYNKDDVSIVSLPLATAYCCAISGSNRKAGDSLLKNMFDAAHTLGAKRHMVALKYAPDPSYTFDGLYRTGDDMLNLLILLREEFTKRSATKKANETQEDAFDTVVAEHGLCFVFIDSMDEFLTAVYQEREESYSPLVELFFKQGKSLGCYFIARFEPSVYASGMFREAYKLFTEHGLSIHVGGQLDRQKHIDLPFITREQTMVQDTSEGLVYMDEQLIPVHIPKN